MRSERSRLLLALTALTLVGACSSGGPQAAPAPASIPTTASAPTATATATANSTPSATATTAPGRLVPEALQSRWWNWAGGTAAIVSPVTDQDGKRCGHRQTPDVWFLAGTTGGHAERSCTVPAGVPIALPLVNLMGTDEQCRTFMATAQGEAVLDGRALQPERVEATTATLFLGANNPFTGKRSTGSATLCGLWVQLDPPSPGAHRLTISGSSADFSTSVAYALTVGT
ncbi:signal protein [Kitasatospora sp. NPDC096147]|uniref:signal protein n=1 Tax=Kitasatospora sp. NPDC096147 TaxID=3364093 RepID=UPI003824CEFC